MADPIEINVNVRITVEIQTPDQSAPKPKPPPESNNVNDDLAAPISSINRVLAVYAEYHPQARPGKRARDLIRARSKEGYTEAQLIEAVHGCHASPWHSGENPGNKNYQSLNLIFRDSDHVQQFIESYRQSQNGDPVLSESTQRTQRAADSFLNRFAKPDDQPAQIEFLK